MITVRRVAGKLGALLLTLFLASLLVFFSRFLVPGDPVSFLLRGRKPSPEAIAAGHRAVRARPAGLAAVPATGSAACCTATSAGRCSTGRT